LSSYGYTSNGYTSYSNTTSCNRYTSTISTIITIFSIY
jgi:hypothetical protein